MPPRAKPEPLSGEAIVARTPRVLRYLADIVEHAQAGDADFTLEAPADLPMDEATFCAVIFCASELADAAGLSATDLRDRADLFATTGVV